MGFKEWQQKNRFNAVLGTAVIKGDTFKVTGTRFKKPVAGATATMDTGAASKGVTLTRVAALGILSLAVKKDKTKCYVLVEFPDGDHHLIDVPAKQEAAARRFTANLNSASAFYGGDE